MIKVKVLIEDENGHQIEVIREYPGELTGKSLDEVESLIGEVKSDTMSASELSLLELNQKEGKKNQG
ncbi:hypothetical protein [uncultured Microscilla sp.]|uniref:hypothetical protein n=1 Tax=uncultured Microscilla sp. TaxID=432653 RepID=UPI002613BC39|nr:hypothetical protein [uncultured Microscilla sp.]